jgi:protein-L-isoaspartate(D-aspartate) O-methyltransferase
MARVAIALILLTTTLYGRAASAEGPDYQDLRRDMVRLVEIGAAVTSEDTGIKDLSPRVLAVMREVPRHLFVPQALRPYAYNDHPLPLGHGQNLASPFVVALMTHLAELEPGDVVFETGTGAGYHAAVLAKLAAEVYSVEVVEPLAGRARPRALRRDHRQGGGRPRAGTLAQPAQGRWAHGASAGVPGGRAVPDRGAQGG